MGDAEKDLTSLRYRNVTSRCRTSPKTNMMCVIVKKIRERDREDERVDPQETSRYKDW